MPHETREYVMAASGHERERCEQQRESERLMIDRVCVSLWQAAAAATSSSSRLLFAFSLFWGGRVGPESARVTSAAWSPPRSSFVPAWRWLVGFWRRSGLAGSCVLPVEHQPSWNFVGRYRNAATINKHRRWRMRTQIASNCSVLLSS